MSTHAWNACLQPLPAQGRNNPGSPRPDFLEQILSTIASLPEAVFAPNPYADIYTTLQNKLGPFTSTLQRMAIMCEALRCTSGYESDWDWSEGADTTAGQETPEEEETGAWQVSANSMNLDPTGSLKARVIEICGLDPQVSTSDLVSAFIENMKSNPAFAVEYAARLFRFNTRWSGPTNRGWTTQAANPDAVAEWQGFLSTMI